MDFLKDLLRDLLEKATPGIRAELVDLILKWEAHCQETESKIDDVLCWVVKKLLLID